jgi:hypothetical protein
MAARYGIDPRSASDLTVRELVLFCEGAADREKAMLGMMLTATWRGAALTAYAPAKPRDFPDLQKVLAPLGLSRAATRRDPEGWRRDFEAMRRYAEIRGQGRQG